MIFKNKSGNYAAISGSGIVKVFGGFNHSIVYNAHKFSSSSIIFRHYKLKRMKKKTTNNFEREIEENQTVFFFGGGLHNSNLLKH